MPYSESLAARTRQMFTGMRGITENKMFRRGRLHVARAYMCVGIWQTSLIARLGPKQAAAALKGAERR